MPRAAAGPRVPAVLLAIGLVALGVMSLRYGDVLLQWQPVPRGAAWRTPLAYASAAVLLIAGMALAIPRTRRAGAAIGCIWFTLWAVGLHGAVVVAQKGSVVSLLGLAEIAAIAIGLGCLVAGPTAGRVRRILTIGFGLCAVVFGMSHFVYADFTATMVPGWLPRPLAIAWLTGVVHLVAGLALVAGVRTKIFACVEAAMMSSFVVLLHLPHVMVAPHDRSELTALGIAWTLTAAAWAVATAARGRG